METEPFDVNGTRTDDTCVDRRHQHAFRVDGMLVEFGPDGPQDSVVRNWSLGPLGLMLLEVDSLSLTPDAGYSAQFVYLAVVRSGGVTIEMTGQTHNTGAGSMLLIDLEEPHLQRFDRHSEAIVIRVPRKILADRGGFRERRLGLLTPDMAEPDVRAVSESVVLVGQQGGRTSLELRRRQGEHLLDILSVIIDDPYGLARRRSSSATLLRAKRFISQNIGNADLSVSLIASAVGASEAHLHRLFRADGYSLMRYVLCHRLELAAELLARRSERRLHIKEVAYRCGFVNAAHFSRTFRRRFGISPRAVATTGLNVERESGDEAPT
ncbi:AraC family transcriptional regulator [Paraburkholderia solisilvae]|nr:AraC family transcriptional regulator [Paraburkholderia solisilvae]